MFAFRKITSVFGNLEGLAGLFLPVSGMFVSQAVTVIVFLTVPLMATEIAPTFGVEAKGIGIFMSIVFAFAMVLSAASGSLIRRWGAIRTIQIGMVFSALCLLLALSASPLLLFVAAALIGIGYGPNTPSGSHVLARVTPLRARAFVFSLKQSGAPLGGLVAGLLIPSMVIAIGWRGAIGVSVAIALVSSLALQPLRTRLDSDRSPSAPIALASPWHALCKLLQHSALRRLTLVAFCLASIQSILMAFLMIILIQQVGLEFQLAGAVFAASQAAGLVLRIIMGWVADRVLGAKPTLVLLGIGSSIAFFLLTQLGPGTPVLFTVCLSIAVGAMSFGWNGVFLAEVVRLAGPGDVGTATGGSLFFIYAGVVLGPSVMSGLITLSGSFGFPIVGIAVATCLASLNLLRPARNRAV
ncbi:MAG TPA: MFS transporter [Gammaproteobacteria bacterium]|nr:MFS transporter [Gammaproteobacteria bacterium]|tara:strand:- start:1753 stop:2988 length:1236 start_codon:yes stop_codon:yes gene_type:complete